MSAADATRSSRCPQLAHSGWASTTLTLVRHPRQRKLWMRSPAPGGGQAVAGGLRLAFELTQPRQAGRTTSVDPRAVEREPVSAEAGLGFEARKLTRRLLHVLPPDVCTPAA